MDLIFLIVLGIVIAYVFMLYRVEKMTDTPNVSDQIKQAVKDIYLADVEAIRNLSEVATKLQAAGLTIPGHTNVKGKMVVGTTSNAAELPAWLALSVDDTGDSHIRLKTKNDDGKNTYIINRDGKLVISAGGDFFSVDKDTTFVGNKLLVNGEINTPNGHTFRCAGRQHMTGNELLYLLHKDGVVIGKEWGGNGSLSVQGNLSVGGNVNIGGRNILEELNDLKAHAIRDDHRYELRANNPSGQSKCVDAGSTNQRCDWNNNWRLFNFAVKPGSKF
jgi:hypothetical protein